ncbi:membrane protein [Paenibacillus agaridevorans]|uniref:Membrane protein n=1 Tax=Paenibacillus agaridevorans TaxID=171404 RepID=A0A2R5EUH7_9BACL|nr:stage II sporulation protein M [Paenibacillus agaridevorans]GBG09329.1 membrane protein [Paenibacillus agaridevorans]
MFKWRTIWRDLKETRGYIAFAAIMFIAGIFIGGSNPAFRSFLDAQLTGLQQLVETVDQAENRTFAMITVIFLNNAIKSIFIIFLGAFLGVIPILFLIINGMVIGYLLDRVAETPDAMPVFELIVKGLLPHGIIEIPAIIIACAYGMRFGILIVRALGSLLFARDKLSDSGDRLVSFMVRVVPVIIMLTAGLLLASIIESTFTGWLLSL